MQSLVSCQQVPELRLLVFMADIQGTCVTQAAAYKAASLQDGNGLFNLRVWMVYNFKIVKLL